MQDDELINKLKDEHSLSIDEYRFILDNYTREDAEFAKKLAVDIRKSVYGKGVKYGAREFSKGCVYRVTERGRLYDVKRTIVR